MAIRAPGEMTAEGAESGCAFKPIIGLNGAIAAIVGVPLIPGARHIATAATSMGKRTLDSVWPIVIKMGAATMA